MTKKYFFMLYTLMNKIDLCFSSKGDNFSRMKGDPFRNHEGEHEGEHEGGPYRDHEREGERDSDHDPLPHVHDEPFSEAVANMLLSSPRRKRYADACAPLDPDLLRAYPVTASEEQSTVLSVSLDPVQVFNNFVESLRSTYNSAKSIALSLDSSISESLTASKTMKSTAKKLSKLIVIESKLEANEVIIDYPSFHVRSSPYVETMKKALAELPPGSKTAESLMTLIEAFEDFETTDDILAFEPRDEVIGKNAFIIRDVKHSRNPLRWMKNLTVDDRGRFIYMKDFYRTHLLESNANALPMVLTRVGSNVFVAEPLIKDPVMRIAEKWFNVPSSLEEFHELAKHVAIADVKRSEDSNETRCHSHNRRECGRTTYLRIGNWYAKATVQGSVQESAHTLHESNGSDDNDLQEMVNDDLWNTVNDLDSANALI